MRPPPLFPQRLRCWQGQGRNFDLRGRIILGSDGTGETGDREKPGRFLVFVQETGERPVGTFRIQPYGHDSSKQYTS